MRQLQKVLWTKGVLLSPQHLQAQDRYLEELIGFRCDALAFAPWGFSRLEIDREALSGGALALTAAAGLLPDGLPFAMPLADALPAPKPLAGHGPAEPGSLAVYLAVPERRPGGQNVSLGPDGRQLRFRAEAVTLRDENTGRSAKPLQLARKNARLLAEGEVLEGHALLQVARVLRGESGDLQLDPYFVPPLLDFAASDYLLALARRLVEILAAKSSSLAGMRRQRNQSLADFGVADVANFWLLYTVNTHLPELRHLLEVRRGHPAELFTAMLALAGALTTFSPSVHPRDLPLYDHQQLGECFRRLDETLRELLETVVPTQHVALPLRLVQPGIYAAALEQDRYLAAPQMYLAVHAQLRADELLRKAPQLLKVSSHDRLGHLIKQALPGLPLRHSPSPPSALPVKLNYHYFQVEKAGAEWEAIRQARNLAVYVPSDFPEPQLEAVILLPPPER